MGASERTVAQSAGLSEGAFARRRSRVVLTGASFGAVLAILLSLGSCMTQVLGFVMGFAVVMLTYFSSKRVGRGFNMALLLVLCGLIVGTLCRILMASEIPLGVLTSIIGAPFFFAILLRTQRGGGAQ